MIDKWYVGMRVTSILFGEGTIVDDDVVEEGYDTVEFDERLKDGHAGRNLQFRWRHCSHQPLSELEYDKNYIVTQLLNDL